MEQSELNTDVIVIGGGPAGLSFARALAPSGLDIIVVEKSPFEVISNPPYDGREIALTHMSKEIMQNLDMWGRIPEDEIYKLREAKVINGISDYQLYFEQPQRARGKPADNLGFLVSNHNIRRSAYESISAFENVKFICGTGVKDLENNAQEAFVILEDNRKIKAQLLVAADSRFSQSRHKMGIATDMHNFGRTTFVFRTEHTESNHLTAMECFLYGRTLALLPLGEHMTNCVVTVDTNKLDMIKSLSKTELAAEMQRLLQNRLGDMKVISEIHHYPLMGVHARQFYSTRAALIGDASVGMHPVTAHGFNLGLESAQLLAKLINEALGKNLDIASEALLSKYSRRHSIHTRVMYHGTNFVVNLFTTETAPAQALRSFIIRASNNLPPVKKLISRQLTG